MVAKVIQSSNSRWPQLALIIISNPPKMQISIGLGSLSLIILLVLLCHECPEHCQAACSTIEPNKPVSECTAVIYEHQQHEGTIFKQQLIHTTYIVSRICSSSHYWLLFLCLMMVPMVRPRQLGLDRYIF